MRRWHRVKPGYYQFLEKTKLNTWPSSYDESILAEVAKGADGRWWMDYLDEKQGWTIKRCKTLRNAQAVAEECCKR
jgi:hypothetical protein